MEVRFRSRRLERLFSSEAELTRTYGQRRARLITARLVGLQQLDTLQQVPTGPPFRRHQLTGNRDEQFAVSIDYQLRLVFEPDHDPMPRNPDSGIATSQVTAIVIIAIEDYHPNRRQR